MLKYILIERLTKPGDIKKKIRKKKIRAETKSLEHEL
jgi:hypothetical protein